MVGATLLIFAAILAIAIKSDLQPFYLAVSVALVIFGGLAFIETFVVRIDLEENTLAIKGLLRTERVDLSQVQKVSGEGGRTALMMKSGTWKKLPEWLGANMSLRRRIADKIGR